jgi:hypothetical protein
MANFSFDEITANATRADPQWLQVPIGLLFGRTIPVRLESLRACIDLVQHDRVGLVMRHHDLEFR